MAWKIVLYESLNDESPVRDFIESLEKKAQSKIYGAIELLKEFGITLKNPYVKKVAGTSFWELRILGRDNIRVFYVAIESKTFILLHCFKKKKQKTPLKEILTAERRLAEYKARKY